MPKAPRIAIGIDLQWPYKHHVGVAGGILRYAEEHGWKCDLLPSLETGGAIRFPPQRYDGVIARATPALAAAVRRLRIPAINVWMNSPDRTLPRVVPDIEACGRLAARHFLDRGFRRLGLLSYEDTRNSRLLLKGLAEAAGPGAPPVTARYSAQVLRIGAAWRRFEATLKSWSRAWKLPIGILAADDLLGRYLADACAHLDLRIPEDVAIISEGNNEILCERLSPPITSIETGTDRVGYRAAHRLHELLRGKRRIPLLELVPPITLVPRLSTDAFAVDDPAVSQALRFITEQAGRRLGVGDVVARLPVTRRSLERRFRQVLGRTIHEEIVRARLHLVKHRLMETDDPIKAIARDSGFSGIEHLSLVFRRHEGLSPGAFRSEHRQGTGARRGR